jgi:hypothetical protein
METPEFDPGTAMTKDYTCCGGIPLEKGQRCPICGEQYEEDEDMNERDAPSSPGRRGCGGNLKKV